MSVFDVQFVHILQGMRLEPLKACWQYYDRVSLHCGTIEGRACQGGSRGCPDSFAMFVFSIPEAGIGLFFIKLFPSCQSSAYDVDGRRGMRNIFFPGSRLTKKSISLLSEFSDVG